MRRFMMILAGAACGAMVGAVAALLLAPTSGDELRQRLNQRVTGFSEDVREAYTTRRAQLEAELEALRSPRSSA